ncbi:Uncharacterized protein APZ42_017070 [Daphnia magna]|uniref:Uncharacterized protein n=1 Tax=Daphnia magna TaxID=35525 RepID=A0A165A1N3_9CRUS|nr:Uncharacterized protein APZ42_017070 [Daphnia magna]
MLAEVIRFSRPDIVMPDLACDSFENAIWLSRFIELEKSFQSVGCEFDSKLGPVRCSSLIFTTTTKNVIVACLTIYFYIFLPSDSTYDLIDPLTEVGRRGLRGLNVRQLANQTPAVVGLKNGLDCARIQRHSTGAALVRAPMFKKATVLLFVQLGHRDSIIDLNHLICCSRCNFVVCGTVE